MIAAPLKGDCLICQAPLPTRNAINSAIWPDGGTARSTEYRAEAQRVAKASKVPELESLDRKTVTRHVEHIEASWRVLGQGQPLRDDEVPVAADFATLTDHGTRVGGKAMNILEEALDNMGVAAFAFYPKETIAIAKLGVVSATTRENSRLKSRQQAIDVMAIFAAGSGHLPAQQADERESSIEELRLEVASERKLLTERAGA